jgi:hypothetical protein
MERSNILFFKYIYLQALRPLPGSPGLSGLSAPASPGSPGLSRALGPGSRSGLSRALGSVFLPRALYICYRSARRADRGGPRTRTRNLSPSHRISGLALLFLITTITPPVEGPIFRSSPETPFHEYAQSGQKETDNQELETANALNTEQILLISSAIVLTIWHLTRAREGVSPVGLPSDKHSLSDDEEPEHYYSNGAPRPAIPRRDTAANPDREMFPLSDDDWYGQGRGQRAYKRQFGCA